MRKCNACSRSTFDTAKFCHHCGSKITFETKDCPACNHPNDVAAKVCEFCNFDFFAPTPPPIPPTKKRSIFDGILEEDEPKTADESPEEDGLDLDVFFKNTAPTLPKMEEVNEEINDIFAKNVTEITPEIEEEEELSFSFEDPEEEEEDVPLTIKKSDIIFEIVENTPSKNATDDEVEDTIEEGPIVEKDWANQSNFEDELNETVEDEADDFEEFELKNPPPINDLFEKNPNQSIESEIFEKFSAAFEYQIKTEQNPAKYNSYVDRFETSDFKINFEFRVKQLAEEIQKIRFDQANLLKDEDAILEQAFTELTDYFIIRYCADLNDVFLSESILQYQNMTAETIDLSKMVLDYLDFDHEDERVHFDFIQMPVSRLQNASKSFLFPEKGEKIFFICDQTILGSGKEGFAMTERAIYWKMQFESAERVYYKNLKQIEPQKDWITINEMFFNASSSLNVKMLKLLKKLKTIV